MTTKSNTTVNASNENIRTFKNATIIKFDIKYLEEKTTVTVTFKSATGRTYTAIAHPAIIWKDRLGSECTVEVYTGAEKWKLYSPTATAKEIEAYETAHAPKEPEYTERKANAKQLTYLASF